MGRPSGRPTFLRRCRIAEKWENHKLIRVEEELNTVIPPGITVAVSVAVTNGDGKALASLRKDYPVWEFAGGKVDEGETPREAAVREIKEELGLDIEIKKFVGSLIVIREDKSYLMMFYTGRRINPGQQPAFAKREVAKIEWVGLKQGPGDRVWWPATLALWEDIVQCGS